MEVTSNFTKIEKDEMISKEIKKLKKLFKGIGKNKINVVMSLIQNAAFMSVTLQDLQMTINRDGAVSTYKNGENQWGTKKSPEVDIYNTMIKNHTAIIRQLTDLLPKGTSDSNDGFDDFVGGRDD